MTAALTGFPARPIAPGRMRAVALLICAIFAVLGVRAAHLAALGPPDVSALTTPAAPKRADLLDRNGELLAGTAPTFALLVDRALMWDAGETAAGLKRALPNLDAGALARRLAGRAGEVQIVRGLTPAERDRVFAQGLPGVRLKEEPRRFYPQGALAAHALGQADADLAGRSGLERAFDAELKAADGSVRTSLDLRVQYALEAELEAGAKAAQAKGGAGIIADGRTGEVLAIASWPAFDANTPPAPDDPRRLDQAVGAVFEMGSTFKPLTVAMALDAGVVSAAERFDVTRPLVIGANTVQDLHPLDQPADLETILARSSNIGAAQIALRLGSERQSAYLKSLGLLDRPGLELPAAEAPLAPPARDAYTVAARGFGHGAAVSLAALAEAYTIFVNQGARVPLTLRLRETPPEPIRVVSPEAAAATLAFMRRAVVDGTARRADLKGLPIAGKTGTAEKSTAGGYAADRNLSSFAAVFPAQQPRYVILLALDEPRPAEGDATGGAVAAPAVARTVARIAPFLGLLPSAAGRPAPGGESP